MEPHRRGRKRGQRPKFIRRKAAGTNEKPKLSSKLILKTKESLGTEANVSSAHEQFNQRTQHPLWTAKAEKRCGGRRSIIAVCPPSSKKMQQYSKDLDFEAAIACRDALSEIKSHFFKS